ncbi:hypothetical protein B0H16DRAFT_1719238 [Mycena metata]|uniref:Uncharacterized protein n=1 Tax=Mycena metata TaxID=1033252 RepID=A0AAD7JDN3_9AGAR|nr:hypothetical protein B0H16DRAFT_1719238 [Mycena metata]
MSRLVDAQGRILVPGVDDMVSAAGVEERAIHEKPDYSISDFDGAAGGKIALSEDKLHVADVRVRLEFESGGVVRARVSNAVGAEGESETRAMEIAEAVTV